MHPIFCAHLIIFLGVVILDMTTTALTLCNLCVICMKLKQISFLYIQTLHNDCSHIEVVHRLHRSRAEFGLV